MSVSKIKKILDEFLDTSEISKKIEQLSIYVDLLLKWNKHINIIARKDETVIWERHIFDSVQLIKFIPINRNDLFLIDIGSGGGLPGIVLAILLPLNITMIEADERKCIFLKESVRKLDLSNVRIVNSRIEYFNQVAEEKEESNHSSIAFPKKGEAGALKSSKIALEEVKRELMADILVARGLTNLSGLLEYSESLLKKTGFCIFPKGKRYQDEILEAKKKFIFEYQAHHSLTSNEGRILEIKNIFPTQKNNTLI